MTLAVDTVRRWRADPVAFVRENFQIEPDLWQVDALSALRTQGVNRLCMKACAGPGKSAVLAWIGWWFLSCTGRVGQHPKGIAVAITADNLKRNLWAELAKWQTRSAYLSAAFTHQAERIFANDHPKTWFLAVGSFAKSANEQEQGQTLSGLHSEFPFVLLDETGSMATAIGRASEQAMGGAVCGLVAQAGNPTSLDGLLYESSVTNRKDWTVVEITADPDDPKRTPRVDAAWARSQIAKWGRSNPWCMAYILGQFPPSAMNALMGAEEVTACLGRHIGVEQYGFAAKVLGVDVARFGDDRTVLFPRQGLAAFPPEIMRNARTEAIAGRASVMNETAGGYDGIMVDGSGGYGAGVIDALRLAQYKPHEIQFGGEPSDSRFFNKRTEMWWEMAQWVKGGGALPNVPELVRELTAPIYYFQNGKIRLEEKDQIKKRLGQSPDLGDALALTFAIKLAPRGLALAKRPAVMGARAKPSTYDPFARR